MTIKAVICDLHGTLIHNEKPIPGVATMVQELRGMGIRIVVASNRVGASKSLQSAGLEADLILDKSITKSNKGSPIWVEKTVEKLGLAKNELAWFGDSKWDMLSAVNAKIIYFNADWSNPDYPYGISITTPGRFAVILREFFNKDMNWFWELSTQDANSRPFIIRAIMDASGAGIQSLRSDLLNFLKYGGNPSVGPFKVRDFIMLHLIGSIYAEGLFFGTDTWTIYPGHVGGPNKAISPFILLAARLFRERYIEDLLIRHTPSADSGQTRSGGLSVGFSNQINTVCLNRQHQSRIEGKNIIVVDDFTTYGWSFECARNLLYEAGAHHVTCVTIGKYGSTHYVVRPAIGYKWDPYSPCKHQPSSFIWAALQCHFLDNALPAMSQSYARVGQMV